ncbi:MAG: antitoxin Xre/MbcA/ParS toxin-binding domain-containing protein [Nitrospiria bacterium]
MATAIKKRLTRVRKSDNPLAEIRRLLNPSDEELSLLLNTGVRTIYRWLEDGPPSQHSSLIKLEELIDLAKKSLKPEAIAEWFHESNRALGGSIPIRLILDPHGFDLVYQELGNAAYGMPL